ncbi:MAG TPA: HlyC/CorC family transporter, partial [Planctomycetaceae bacterium]|nr:HlyC/CorC family transporter [Planctomycetaceae bacterium]
TRHQLEAYCRRRGKVDSFSRILANHDHAALAAESLQMLGFVLLVAAGVLFWMRPSSADSSSPSFTLLGRDGGMLVIAAVSLLATLIWIPRAVVRVWSAPLIYHGWPLWRTIEWLLWPLTLGVYVVDTIINRLAGKNEEEEDEEEAFEDEIRTIVTAGLREGLLEEDAREMIEGVIELGDTDVLDIMTPRSEIDALDSSLSWPEVFRFVVEVGRTRIPVFEKTLDNIIGILYVKDLFPELSRNPREIQVPLSQLVRKPWFVPASKAVDDLLQEFLRTRNHMAVVVDEYRAVAGVVTIEDALEEIVGEIVDEHDKEEEDEIQVINEQTIEVLGRTHIDEINECCGWDLSESEDYDTVGGLILRQLGYIPDLHEELQIDDLKMIVLEVSRRRIERVRLQKLGETMRETA